MTGDGTHAVHCAGCHRDMMDDHFPLGQLFADISHGQPLCLSCFEAKYIRHDPRFRRQRKAKAEPTPKRQRKARKPPKPAKEFNLATRFAILKRDHYHCRLCGRGAEDGTKLEVDHKMARSRGGTNAPDNLWTLCFECNRGKHDQEL